MSEGTAKKRIKLKLGMPSPQNGTPQGSRAGSPDTGPPRNGSGANPANVGSRAGSPDAGAPAAARKGTISTPLFTLHADILTFIQIPPSPFPPPPNSKQIFQRRASRSAIC